MFLWNHCRKQDPANRKELGWKRRFLVIRGTAEGLECLHKDRRVRIIHRYIKACNALLDQKYQISDLKDFIPVIKIPRQHSHCWNSTVNIFNHQSLMFLFNHCFSLCLLSLMSRIKLSLHKTLWEISWVFSY